MDLRGYLRSLDPAELVELLLTAAADDPALHRQLSLLAAAERADSLTETGDPDAGPPPPAGRPGRRGR